MTGEVVEIKNTAAVERSLEYGPAMQRLSPMRRAFVIALLNDPSDNATRAAIEAGYSKEINSAKSIGSRLRTDKAVLEAIHECAVAQLNSLKLIATQTCQEVMRSPITAPRDKLRAAAMVFDRCGMGPESTQNVVVEHKPADRREQVRELVSLARQAGLDPVRLLGQRGITLDASFEEIEPLAPVPGLEDVTG